MRNKILKVSLIGLCLVIIAVTLLAGACTQGPTPDKPENLIFASFIPPVDAWCGVAEEWGNELIAETGGRYTVEYSWGGALGPTPEYYNMLTQGVCDVAFCIPTMVAGRFPMAEMLVLPWARPSSEIANAAFWDLYEKGYFDEELADVQVCYLQAGGSFSLFSTKPVNSVADLKGLKIRISGAPQSDLVTALGATPVNIPGGEQYAAMEKGTVDGVLTSTAAVKAYKLQEVTKYVVEPSFTGAQLFAAIMNKDTYDNLHKDGQEFIAATGKKYTMLAAAANDSQCADGYNALLEAGAEVCKLSAADLAEMDKLCASLWTKWIADMEAKGFSDAKNALDDYYNLMKGLGLERPAVGYTP